MGKSCWQIRFVQFLKHNRHHRLFSCPYAVQSFSLHTLFLLFGQCSSSACSSLFVWCNTDTRTNISHSIKIKKTLLAALWNLEMKRRCICVSFLLGFEELPPPQILRNEDSRLPLTFSPLFPRRLSDGDGYRGKQQQEETILTVTAISPSVISIRILPRAPWDPGILSAPMNLLGPHQYHMLLNTTSTPKPNETVS